MGRKIQVVKGEIKKIQLYKCDKILLRGNGNRKRIQKEKRGQLDLFEDIVKNVCKKDNYKQRKGKTNFFLNVYYFTISKYLKVFTYVNKSAVGILFCFVMGEVFQGNNRERSVREWCGLRLSKIKIVVSNQNGQHFEIYLPQYVITNIHMKGSRIKKTLEGTNNNVHSYETR